MRIRLIGVDCATDDAKVGLALGSLEDARLNIERAVLCTRKDSACATIASWLSPAEEPALLAIDAPLGWPALLSRALIEHRAGQQIDVLPNDMFRRATDRFIQRELRKTPLDVGADRIARTAHAALRLLGDLRGRLNLPIPLAWNPILSAPLAAIEVYPAATLTSYGFQASGYKAANHTAERGGIIDSLRKTAELPSDCSAMQASADALDAAVCLLAAVDFLRGEAMRPEDQAVAEREGWIWVRAPKRQDVK
jgi:predicted RNase H-like nuclease